MAKRTRKAEDGFNLAFLDVMACGLGAVILIFMLVDFQDVTIDPSAEKERLEQELAASEQEQQQLKQSVDEINDNIAMQTQTEQEAKEKQQTIEAKLDDIKKAIATQQAVVADLENQRAALLKKVNTAAPIEKVGTGEQNYIVGLPVVGKNIGILIDKSTSMMDIELVSILLANTLPDNQKVAQPKWMRTKNIAKWLLSRLPPESRVTTVVFSEDATALGLRDVMSARVQASLNSVVSELGGVIPKGGTNLALGLETIMQANPNIDSLYIITDGLPTLGPSISGCGLAKTRKTITAECRKKMGEKTLAEFYQKHKGVKLNTILLPIEGDPYASSVYWTYTRASGGKMLSPALEWN